MAESEAAPAGLPERLVFWRRQLLRFPGLSPGSRYSIPFFLHHEDGIPVFTKFDGSLVAFCVDSEYEALDHCLLWLDLNLGYDDTRSTTGDEASACIYCYLSRGTAAPDVWASCPPEAVLQKLPGLPRPGEEVMAAAERLAMKEEVCGAPPGWEVYAGLKEAARVIPVDPVQPGQRLHPPHRVALQLNASMSGNPLPLKGVASMTPLNAAGAGVQLRKPVASLGVWITHRSRLHLRARFLDTMAGGVPQCHWIGLSSHLGTAAVGLAPQFPDHYASIGRHWHDGVVPRGLHRNWQRSGVKRAEGWHTFEVILESGHLCIQVDGEPVSIGTACDVGKYDAIWLASECGSTGNWSAIELLHTPLGRGSWDTGLQQVEPASAKPWESIMHEEGYWSIAGAGPMEQLPVPVPEEPPQVEEEEAFETPSGDAEEVEPPPPPVEAPVRPRLSGRPAPPRRPGSKKSQRPAKKPLGGLAIECWSKPGETDLARLDRVIGEILARLLEANVVVPSNFQRVADCEEPQHEKCYVFSFGTRRLHINVREGAGGRVTLAVRVGGGYMDLVEFVSKNGSVEQLRLQQALGTAGEAGRHARFCSVLTNGRRQLRDKF